MKEIFIVIGESASFRSIAIEGVFDSKELAQAFIDTYIGIFEKKELQIEAYPLNPKAKESPE